MFAILAFETDPFTKMVDLRFSFDFYGKVINHSALLHDMDCAERRIVDEKRSYILSKIERLLRNCEKMNGMNKSTRWTEDKAMLINRLFKEVKDYHDYNYTLIQICSTIKSSQNLLTRSLPSSKTTEFPILETFLEEIIDFCNNEIRFKEQKQIDQVIRSRSVPPVLPSKPLQLSGVATAK